MWPTLGSRKAEDKTRQSHVWQLTGTHVTVMSAQSTQERWFCWMPCDQSTRQDTENSKHELLLMTMMMMMTAVKNIERYHINKLFVYDNKHALWRRLPRTTSHNCGTLPASEATHTQATYKIQLNITSGIRKTENVKYMQHRERCRTELHASMTGSCNSYIPCAVFYKWPHYKLFKYLTIASV